MNKVNLLLRSKLRPFIIAFIAVFTMVVIQIIITRLDRPILTVPHIQLNQFDQIRPKLEQKTNNFQIKKTQDLVPSAYAGEEYDHASAFTVVDMDSGQVILEKNSSQKLPIASLTKVMTAIVALDLSEASNQFTVSETAANIQPTKMGLVPQQRWNRNELLTAMLLTSANDAAQVFEEAIDQRYGNGAFIKAMNEKAKFLGLKNTRFDNPQGFDGTSNFSSVEDLAVLTNYGLQNYPLFAEIVAKDYQFYPDTQDHKQADLYNWNGLLGVYPGISGVKIGNTGQAGYTTIVVSERDGKKLLAVLLGAPGVLERDLWTSQLLDLGFEKTWGLLPINITRDQLLQKYNSWEYFR